MGPLNKSVFAYITGPGEIQGFLGEMVISDMSRQT